jgi:hypothetical protein
MRPPKKAGNRCLFAGAGRGFEMGMIGEESPKMIGGNIRKMWGAVRHHLVQVRAITSNRLWRPIGIVQVSQKVFDSILKRHDIQIPVIM